jgi:hypothetical protein
MHACKQRVCCVRRLCPAHLACVEEADGWPVTQDLEAGSKRLKLTFDGPEGTQQQAATMQRPCYDMPQQGLPRATRTC